MRSFGGVVIRVAAVGALLAALWPAGAFAAVSNPVVEGPIEGGLHNRPFNQSLFDLKGDGYDYTEREYFFSGTATSLETGASAPYKSRMLVRLPRNPSDFSGTVVVEWLNVTGQEDLETSWPVEGPFLMRHGVGYVGVSAQLAGVCCGPTTLKGWDPQRYGALVHPGDNFSYDIVSQAIQALRHPAGNATTAGSPVKVDPSGGLNIRKVVLNGASQSAFYLTTFVNDHYNRGNVDLFVITRGGGPFTDLSTPVFQLNEENNKIPQADGPRLVGWEEAGTAHAPAVWWNYIQAQNRRDLTAPGTADAVNTACSVNRGSTDYSARALSYWSERYLTDGTLPPSAPRMQRDANGNVMTDANGLALGGLRHPFIQVPVAYNSASGCPLFGTYTPWSAAKIKGLYATHCDYVTRVRAWADQEVQRGWLLPEDRDDAIAKSIAFGDPWPGESLASCAAARSGTSSVNTVAPAAPTSTNCLIIGGPAAAGRLGSAGLGRRRVQQRKALGVSPVSARRGIDRYCVAGGGTLSIGYPSRRLARLLPRARTRAAGHSLLIVTSSPHVSVAGVAAGSSARGVGRRLRAVRLLRRGRQTWFRARSTGVPHAIYRVRSGRVTAVGITDPRLTRAHRALRALLAAAGR